VVKIKSQISHNKNKEYHSLKKKKYIIKKMQKKKKPLKLARFTNKKAC